VLGIDSGYVRQQSCFTWPVATQNSPFLPHRTLWEETTSSSTIVGPSLHIGLPFTHERMARLSWPIGGVIQFQKGIGPIRERSLAYSSAQRTGGPKMAQNSYMPITSSNINRFLKLFYW